MVEITESLSCLYTGSIERNADGEYVVRVPSREVEHGTVDLDGTYRVALIARDDDGSTPEGSSLEGSTSEGSSSGRSTGTGRTTAAGADGNDAATNGSGTATNGNGGSGGRRSRAASSSGPPVSEGDVRDVTIETLGDKGDGIAKIERGYVVIVPDSDLGDEITVEITSVRDNVSFATVLDE